LAGEGEDGGDGGSIIIIGVKIEFIKEVIASQKK
jgi:hypothetical protein